MNGEVLPLSIANMWFRTLAQSDNGNKARRHAETDHIRSSMRFETGSTDCASKTCMWANVQHSVPIPLGECVGGRDFFESGVRKPENHCQEGGYHGPAVREGTNDPDFLFYQSPRLVQTLHSISAELEATGVKEIFGSEKPDLEPHEVRTSFPLPSTSDFFDNGVKAPELDERARERYRSPRNKMTLQGGPSKCSAPFPFVATARPGCRPPSTPASSSTASMVANIFEKRWDPAILEEVDFARMWQVWESRHWRETGTAR